MVVGKPPGCARRAGRSRPAGLAPWWGHHENL